MTKASDVDHAVTDLQQMTTALITNAMGALGLSGGWINGLTPLVCKREGCYVGPAMTLQWAHRRSKNGRGAAYSYEVIRKRTNETILVIAGGVANCFFFGDNAATAAKVEGFQAVLVDGGVRDVAGLNEVGIGIFSSGVAVAPPTDFELVADNVPVLIRGQWVQPGDIVAFDIDGAVVFPAEMVPEIRAKALAIKSIEDAQREIILRRGPLAELNEMLGRKKHA